MCLSVDCVYRCDFPFPGAVYLSCTERGTRRVDPIYPVDPVDRHSISYQAHSSMPYAPNHIGYNFANVLVLLTSDNVSQLAKSSSVIDGNKVCFTVLWVPLTYMNVRYLNQQFSTHCYQRQIMPWLIFKL